MLGLLESATRSGGAPLGSLTTTWPLRTFTPETRCWKRYTVAPPGSGITATGFNSLVGALAMFVAVRNFTDYLAVAVLSFAMVLLGWSAASQLWLMVLLVEQLAHRVRCERIVTSATSRPRS